MDKRKLFTILIIMLLLSTLIISNAVFAKENITKISDAIEYSVHSLVDKSRLEPDPEISMQFIWSQNRTKLLVTAVLGIRSKSLPENSEWGPKEAITAIYVMNVDDSELTKVASAENSIYTMEMDNATIVGGALWSPKGDKICFEVVNISSHTRDLYVVSFDGTGMIPITTNKFIKDVTWSPDGSKIAFSAQGYIYIADADRSKVEKIPVNNAGNPVWSQNGYQLLFIKFGVNTNGEIWMVNGDGTNLKRVTTFDPITTGVRWSPNSKKILIDGSVMNADGSEKVRVGVGEWKRGYWSPSGEKILFTSIDEQNKQYRLYVVDADGSNMKLLAYGEDENEIKDVSWSPDGNRIAFLIGKNTLKCLYTVNKNGNGKAAIECDVWKYAWSPEGDKIAFSSGYINRSIYITSPGGTQKKKIIIYRYNNLISWSPNGKYLLITSYNTAPWNHPTKGGTYLVKLAGYEEAMSVYAPTINMTITIKENIEEKETPKTPNFNRNSPSLSGLSNVLVIIVLITVFVLIRMRNYS